MFLAIISKVIAKENQMTQSELSEASGVGQSTISGYVNGKPANAKYRHRVLEAIQNTLGYSDNELLDIANKELEWQKTVDNLTKHKKQTESISDDEEKQEIQVVDIDPVTTEHRDLVGKFVSKKIALEANRVMIELDIRDPLRFAELAGIIRKFSEGQDFIEKQSPERRKKSSDPDTSSKTMDGANQQEAI